MTTRRGRSRAFWVVAVLIMAGGAYAGFRAMLSVQEDEDKARKEIPAKLRALGLGDALPSAAPAPAPAAPPRP